VHAGGYFLEHHAEIVLVEGRRLPRLPAFIARSLGRKVRHDIEAGLRRVVGHAREATYVEVEHPARASEAQGG
jgi:hypothetical protein